jgi:hypothetical protein
MEMVMVDSLVASEFEVTLEDKPLKGVFRIQGLVTYAVDEQGQRRKPPFTLSKMVQQNPHEPINVWLRETLASRHGGERPRRDLQIKAVDDGVVTRIWHVRGAYILSVGYSDFDESSFEMVAETFTFAYEDIEDEFTLLK